MIQNETILRVSNEVERELAALSFSYTRPIRYAADARGRNLPPASEALGLFAL